MAEKKVIDESNDLHVLIDMKIPQVYMSFRGNTKNATEYMSSTKCRDMKIRHIRVDEKGNIRLAKEDGEVLNCP